jgi:signal transduction histidine kinase/CheY-like chemotaxis protein
VDDGAEKPIATIDEGPGDEGLGDEGLGALAEALPIICWQADADGTTLAFNGRWDDYAGGDRAAAADNAAVLQEAIRAAGGEDRFSATLSLRGGDWVSRPFLTHARRAPGPDGAPGRWVGTCTEVSEHVASERAHAFLLRLGDELRDESNPETILAMTSRAIGRELGADRVVYATIDWKEGVMHVRRDWRASGPPVTPHKYPMSNYSQDHVDRHSQGEPILSFDVANDPELIDVMRQRFLTVGVQAFASVPLVKRGTLTAVMAAQQFAPRRWTDAEVQLLEEVADRTWATLERAEAAAALRESEQLFRMVTEAHPIPVIIAQDSGIVLGNPAFFEMMDLPANSDASVIDPRSWSPGGQGWTEFAAFVRAHRRYDNYETVMVRGGVRFPVAVSWRHIGYKGEPAVISSIVDLTERKRAEEELVRSREALHQAEKLTALGSLLAGVSHELNNPLTIVTAQASLLEELAIGTPMAARAEKVRRAAVRCSKIVQTFLAMARQKEPERSTVQAADVLRAALDLTEYSLRTAGIDVSLDIAPDLPPLHADPDQLHQVFVNLIVNAQQALQETAGERRLRLRLASADEGRSVQVEIEDNGPGVPAEIRRRVFEPFFTTKPEGVGTGVGLSFSLGLVEAHGGRLELLDAPGGGACFRVTLDTAAAAPAEAPREATPVPIPSGKKGAALIVDDEPDVAEVLEILAARAGYRVDVAANGREAIARLSAADYDVILSDLRMPELDGPALYAWLEREKPHLTHRIAFVTGDTLGDAASRFLKTSNRPVLEKPFSGRNVRTLLERLAAAPSG